MFFARICSGSSLKGMVRGEPADDDDPGGTSGSTTPNDTAHGGSKFNSSSWRKLASRSTRSLSSPKKPNTPPPSVASSDSVGPVRPSMEPVMERTRSALTDLEAVKFLVEDWSHKCWRPATPQDQERFDRLEQSDIKPLVALGEGAFGSVNLCRIVVNGRGGGAGPTGDSATIAGAGPDACCAHAAISTPAATSTPASPFNAREAQALRRRSASAATVLRPVTAPSDVLDRRSAASVPAAPAARGSGGLSDSGNASAAGNGATCLEADRNASDGRGAVEGVEVGGAAASASGSVRSPSPPRDSDGGAGAEAVVPEGLEERLGDEGDSQPPPAEGEGAPEDGANAGHDGAAADAVADEGVNDGADAAADAAAAAAATPVLAPVASLSEPQLIVAVKRVPLGWNQERELMQLHRCQQCPFIVRLFGFVDDGTEHCSYVMEWAEGGDLGAMLASLKDRRGANKQRLLMSEGSARYYLGCLLLALEFMHGHGLLHRDIKPGNLLLTSNGTAKLADLGFTVALDANGTTVGCCGTTGYIAPEVYAYGTAKMRRPYGVPSDIWSAGATLYQILTGNVVTDAHEEVLKKGWRPPANAQFSKALQDLLNRMLAAKPHARPQSAASVMRHPWFAGFDWQALREGRMKAPYVPAERRRVRQPDEAGSSAAGSTALGGTGAAAGGGGSGGGAAAAGGGGPPPASPYGQRLATVMERAPSGPPGGGQQEGDAVVQRSAMSDRDEGSVKRGREGLARDAPSFDTVLPTLPTAEAKAAGAFGGAAPPLAPVPPPAGCAATVALSGGGSDGVPLHASPTDDLSHGGREVGGGAGGLRHGHGANHQGLTVRFAMGVAECA